MILLFGALFLSACQKDDEVENSSPPKVDLKKRNTHYFNSWERWRYTFFR